MPRFLITSVIVASILAPLACAQGTIVESSGAAGSDGSTGPTTTTTSTTTTSSSTASCTLPDAGAEAYTGSLSLYRINNGSPQRSFEMITEFGATPPVAAPACPGTQMGPCCFSPPGTVTIAGNASTGSTQIEDGATTIFEQMGAGAPSVNALTWEPGDLIQITTGGAMVDPFTATLVAPVPVSGISPPFDLTSVAASLGEDFVLSWEPSSQACAQIVFGMRSSGLGASLFCTVPDAAGTLTVPAAFLNSSWNDSNPTISIERRVVVAPDVANASVTVELADVLWPM